MERSRIRLLIYSHFFAPSVGGVETIVLSLARGLSEVRSAAGMQEFDVVLVTKTLAKDFDDGALPFRIVRKPGLARLWRLIRCADVVHVAGPAFAPLLLSFLGRRPVVVEHHGYQAICPNGLLVCQPGRTVCPGHFEAGRYSECIRCEASETSLIRSWASLLLMFPRQFLVRRAAANIAVTQYVKKRLALPQTTTIYHGAEDTLKMASARQPGKKTPAGICFAYVGRFVTEKGIHVLVEAANSLKEEGHNFEVRLIGDGPERPNLEALIARHHLQHSIRIMGYLTGEAIAAALEDVQVVVMPSICEETAGLAAIEQMVRGRLVIASEIGGLGEVVADAGLVCIPGSVEDLARAMRQVIYDVSLVASLGRKARDRAVHLFLHPRMIAEHSILYRAVWGN